MRTREVVEIHVASSIASLNKLIEVPGLSNTILSTEKLIKTGQQVFERAGKAYDAGDDEESYLFYMRFLDTVQTLRNTIKNSKRKTDVDYIKQMLKSECSIAMQRAEDLQKDLERRYKIKSLAQKYDSEEEQLELHPKIIPIKNGSNFNQSTKLMPPVLVEGSQSVAKPMVGMISAKDLYDWMLDKGKNYLVIDIRPRDDYVQSHLKTPALINIPSKFLEAGCLCITLEKRLEGADFHLFRRRHSYDRIVVMDSATWFAQLCPGTAAKVLIDAINVYDSSAKADRAVLLDGGFNNFHRRYPSQLTNANLLRNGFGFAGDADDDDLPPKSGGFSLASVAYPSFGDVNGDFVPVGKSTAVHSDSHPPGAVSQGPPIETPSAAVSRGNDHIYPAMDGLGTSSVIYREYSETLGPSSSYANDTKNPSSDSNSKSSPIIRGVMPTVDRSVKPKAHDSRGTSGLDASNVNSNSIDTGNRTANKSNGELGAAGQLGSTLAAWGEENEKANRAVAEAEERLRLMRQDRDRASEQAKHLEDRYGKKEEERVAQIDRLIAENDRLKRAKESDDITKAKMKALEVERLRKIKMQSISAKGLNVDGSNQNSDVQKMASVHGDPSTSGVQPQPRATVDIDAPGPARGIPFRSSNDSKVPSSSSAFANGSPSAAISNLSSKSSEHFIGSDSNRSETALSDILPNLDNPKSLPAAGKSTRSAAGGANYQHSDGRISDGPSVPKIVEPGLRPATSATSTRQVTRLHEGDGNSRDTLSPSSLGGMGGGMKRFRSQPDIQALMQNEQALDIASLHMPAQNEAGPSTSARGPAIPDRMIKPKARLSSDDSGIGGQRMQSLSLVFGSQDLALTGLRNLGNTCYMNSIIQCLSNTVPLADYFLRNRYEHDLNKESKLGYKGRFAEEFAWLIKNLWKKEHKYLSPSDFRSFVAQVNSMFRGYEQQDSSEFLMFVLDALHEDLNRVDVHQALPKSEPDNLPDTEGACRAWQLHLSRNNSVIVGLFQGQLKSTLECCVCRKRSVKFDTFMYLSLPLPPNARKCSIEDCLRLFLAKEHLTGSSRWNCPQCKTLRDATKHIELWKLPTILLIHFKRFQWDGRWREKLTHSIQYPLNDFDLKDFVVGEKPRVKYDLYALSHHTGTLEAGHYTSLCWNANRGSWYKYDDIEVYDISRSSAQSPGAYILFYSCEK